MERAKISVAKMTLAKTKAAEPLFPMLSAFHSIADQSLRAVWHISADSSPGRIVLQFDSVSLNIRAREDDDSIYFAIEHIARVPRAGDVDASGLDPWAPFVGKRFGWGWVTINQQGYCDGLLLSFEGIVPRVILNVMASSLELGTISMRIRSAL